MRTGRIGTCPFSLRLEIFWAIDCSGCICSICLSQKPGIQYQAANLHLSRKHWTNLEETAHGHGSTPPPFHSNPAFPVFWAISLRPWITSTSNRRRQYPGLDPDSGRMPFAHLGYRRSSSHYYSNSILSSGGLASTFSQEWWAQLLDLFPWNPIYWDIPFDMRTSCSILWSPSSNTGLDQQRGPYWSPRSRVFQNHRGSIQRRGFLRPRGLKEWGSTSSWLLGNPHLFQTPWFRNPCWRQANVIYFSHSIISWFPNCPGRMRIEYCSCQAAVASPASRHTQKLSPLSPPEIWNKHVSRPSCSMNSKWATWSALDPPCRNLWRPADAGPSRTLISCWWFWGTAWLEGNYERTPCFL